MFGWLFRKMVTREEAVIMATEFLAANGCRVIASEADADMAGDDIPVMFVTAHVPGRRWYVEFEEVHPPGMWKSNTRIIVYIWANTGRITFDHFEGW